MSKTRLIEAVRKLNLEATKQLLEAKPSLVAVTDPRGRNLLHLACSASCARLNVSEKVSAQMVNFLLECGLDVESPLSVKDDECSVVTAVWFAVARGRNPTLVKLLIKRGARPTGLYAAGWYEDIPMLNLLIRAGATIDEVGGDTSFLACWKWRKFEAAKFLARKGADVNLRDSKGRTALRYGVEKEFDPALLRWLVKHGASPDIEDHDGMSARQKAARKRNKRFLEALA